MNLNPYHPPTDSTDKTSKKRRSSYAYELMLFGGLTCMIAGVSIGMFTSEPAAINGGVMLFVLGVGGVVLSLR